MKYVCNSCTHPRQARELRRFFPCETRPVCGDNGTASVFICDGCDAVTPFAEAWSLHRDQRMIAECCSATCCGDWVERHGEAGAIVLDPLRRYA